MRIGVPALRILAVAYLLSIPGLIYQAALQGLSLERKYVHIHDTPGDSAAGVCISSQRIWKPESDMGRLCLAELCGIPLAAALWKRKGEKQIQF